MGKIFENYKAICSNCGAELSPEDKQCPYCLTDLKEENKDFHKGDKQIVDAMKRVDKASRNLEIAEQYAEKNTYKKSKERKKLILLLIVGVFIGFVILMGVIGTIIETTTDKKIEKIENQLHNQTVDATNIKGIEDIEKQNFTNTQFQHSAGYIEENEKLLKVPFYSDDYSNDAIYKTNIYLNKFEIEKVNFSDGDYVAIYGENGIGIFINVENGVYYEKPVDALILTDITIDRVTRLDNIEIDDILFECYKIDNDEYYMIANPYPELYITYEIQFYGNETELSIEDFCFLKDIEIEMS